MESFGPFSREIVQSAHFQANRGTEKVVVLCLPAAHAGLFHQVTGLVEGNAYFCEIRLAEMRAGSQIVGKARY